MSSCAVSGPSPSTAPRMLEVVKGEAMKVLLLVTWSPAGVREVEVGEGHKGHKINISSHDQLKCSCRG